MTEIFLLSMLTGGLAAMVDKAGGIDYLLHQIKKRIKSKRSAQAGIGALVGFANVAIANNTVSIVITGGIAKEINDEYDLSPKKTAAILGITCFYLRLLWLPFTVLFGIKRLNDFWIFKIA